MNKRIQVVAALFLALVSGFAVAADKHPKVLLETSMGNIVLELNAEKAPITVKNFVRYVHDGFYDGTIFHRVINNFMVQGGGMTPKMVQKSGNPPIKNEGGNGLKNVNGSVAMARTSNPDSASSQFFINVNDNGFLNRDHPRSDGHGYAVFGKVIEGMDVVDEIKRVKTTTKSGHRDVPVTQILINKASMVK